MCIHIYLDTYGALTLHPPTFHPPIHFFSVFEWLSTRRGSCRSEAPSTACLPLTTTNHLLVEPSGCPWVNCAWVKVLLGRFVSERIIKALYMYMHICVYSDLLACVYIYIYNHVPSRQFKSVQLKKILFWRLFLSMYPFWSVYGESKKIIVLYNGSPTVSGSISIH